ncbi:CSC1-like protein ERD4 [Seminavis robusta]|uniref:CSC1-like protein ERD4 n=1 Tax=Seminavis robusta TaxID=568900 RepID=A0A9N8HDK6_9STRA|nr:CSC1-like protein ERD4 [Seminavis robusta]|eukprot:Sro263_g102330.1 CSC1-like protein ERD4 (1071) ;mRNA; f:60610-64307
MESESYTNQESFWEESIRHWARRLKNYQYSFPSWGNSTGSNDFESNLTPPEDVSVDAVVSSLYFNTIVFICLMGSYELLRRLLPAVYSSRQRQLNTRGWRSGLSSRDDDEAGGYLPEGEPDDGSCADLNQTSSLSSLPDQRPLDWIGPVFGIPWEKVRQKAGLDGYFFLRYIRMCVRITAVSSFWAFILLVPLYGTGATQEGAEGWYHISIANISRHSWRMWVPPFFACFFTGFTFFVMKQEYKHFVQLRMEFLAKGDTHVHPQHHYSLMVENIPIELRSDRALFEYFDKLFPGKIHSASVVLNLPDLEAVSARCHRVCERLEKSIAYYEAYGDRPTHYVGVPRITVLGLQSPPLSCFCCKSTRPLRFDGDDMETLQRPQRGAHVDSISYYIQDMAATSRALIKMQKRKSRIAQTGNREKNPRNWIDKVMEVASEYAKQIMEDSEMENALQSKYTPTRRGTAIPQVEQMSIHGYGSFGYQRQPVSTPPQGDHCDVEWNVPYDTDRRSHLLSPEDAFYRQHSEASLGGDGGARRRPSSIRQFPAPGAEDHHRTTIRKVLGRLGLDFIVSGVSFINRQLDITVEGVVGTTMSSTGFVTFLDLTSVTCAASAPLTHKPGMLNISVAPDPKEIRWRNAHAPQRDCERREVIVNFLLFLGVILWSFPLAAIQAFAKASFIAQIPGMEWILTFQGGALTAFVNGYLPVLALLGIILILPVIFEAIAVTYERRKTFSEIQRSILKRYFYYQLANIYITVTAGSLWKSLGDIIDHPSNVLQLLGQSLPTMVGYFVALLVTKILAGLPMIFLRFGALSRMLLLKSLSAENKLTQRELDAIYRQENVQYGWEFPSQLLVIVIVFTYATLCPVILPVGMLYFMGSLIVYKKQVLYVYTPIYESGGTLFSDAVQRTLFGLVCGQLTLIGYFLTRGIRYQALFLLPLPVCTVYGMQYFKQHYADPSMLLSMERAREYDRVSEYHDDDETPPRGGGLGSPRNGIESRRRNFDSFAYKQPVLTERVIEPLPYRRGKNDEMTLEARELLGRIRGLAAEESDPSHNAEHSPARDIGKTSQSPDPNSG